MGQANARFSMVAAGALAAAALLCMHHPIQAEPVMRTAYATVTDNQNAFVPDLAAADLTLKEGGKSREITGVEKSKSPMRIAILVEDSLTGDTPTREGLFQFIRKLEGKATFAIFLVGRRNVRAIDYTADIERLRQAIDDFPIRRPTLDENLVEGISEAARDLSRQEGGRRVILALAIEHIQPASMSPDQALDKLRDSGAMLYAATLVSGINESSNLTEAIDDNARDRVLSEGTKHSGGRRLESLQTAGIPAVLLGFANELVNQYAITYLLPEGIKPNRNLSIKAVRKGITVRAATDVPDK